MRVPIASQPGDEQKKPARLNILALIKAIMSPRSEHETVSALRLDSSIFNSRFRLQLQADIATDVAVAVSVLLLDVLRVLGVLLVRGVFRGAR